MRQQSVSGIKDCERVEADEKMQKKLSPPTPTAKLVRQEPKYYTCLFYTPQDKVSVQRYLTRLAGECLILLMKKMKVTKEMYQ